MFGSPSNSQMNLDPFLDVTLFRMSQPTFRPHPHAGFSAVTYMLPESAGMFQNRDSLGDKSLIHPGSIHWTQAGFGMMHEEIPTEPGVECFGFQIFINLSQKNKHIAPKSFHADADEIPCIDSPEFQLRVVSGQYKMYESPLRDLATPVDIFDITVQKESKAEIHLQNSYNYFIFCISGEAELFNHKLTKGHIAILDPESKESILSNNESSAFRAIIAGGTKINEPIMWSGPFAMCTKEELVDAEQRFLSGKMGYLESSF